ncbi:hypothetical protein [uncultured Pseudacidovorax sp.]|nr:hypothetical protein [uncultured Pseudacidovorax sp.]
MEGGRQRAVGGLVGVFGQHDFDLIADEALAPRPLNVDFGWGSS